MNFIMPCVQAFFCNCLKKSTDTDYYVDPKLLSFRKPVFEPEKIQNKVTESEFMEIRNEIANAGGKWWTSTKFVYIFMIIHAVLCFAAYFGKLIASAIFDKRIEALEVSTVVNITCLMLPNIISQICMKIFMKKACIGVQKFFDAKNEEIYTARGINWLTCGTLLFIHVKILETETELKEFGEYCNNSLLLMGTSGNNMSAFETINKNSNKEILLKKYQNQGSDLI